MGWDPGYPLARAFANDALFIGEWRCAGSTTRDTALEQSRHFEIALQRTGSHARQTGREHAVADAAHVVLQMAGDAYRIRHPVAQPERSLILLVSPALVRDVFPPGPLRSRGVPLTPHAALARRELDRALAGAGALAVEETALALLEAVATTGTAPRVAAGPHRVLAEEIQHQLARRYRSQVSLDEIARAVGVSPWHASRVFRREVGMPMRRYLIRLRVYAALEALDARRGDWARLALEVGFASHSHFTDAFVRELGRAPSAVARPRRA